jgi:hypothetical protein
VHKIARSASASTVATPVMPTRRHGAARPTGHSAAGIARYRFTVDTLAIRTTATIPVEMDSVLPADPAAASNAVSTA